MSRATNMFSESVTSPTTVNKEGFPAYTRSLKERYLQMLLTNTMGNTYYSNSKELLESSEKLHDEMIKADSRFAADALAFARKEGYMRLQPIFGVVKLFEAKSSWARWAFSKVILIPSDLQDFMTIYKGRGHGEGGRAVKNAVNFFLGGVSEYWAIKYNGRGRGYSLGDIVATSHPKAHDDKQNNIYRYLLGKDFDANMLPQINCFENLKEATSETERIEYITRGRLPHEVVTGAIKPTKGIWSAILQQMPLFALLRNLNTIDRAGVLEEHREYIINRLTDGESLKKSKILPFRFMTAYKNLTSDFAWLSDALRGAVESTFDNIPDIDGTTAVFLDISGSMEGEYLDIGSIFALALYKKTKGSGVFWLFNTEVIDPKASIHDSIISQAERIRAYGGTNTGAPVAVLTYRGIKVDNIIMITDEQQNRGSRFFVELVKYREKINKEVKTFIVDLAPYDASMIPPMDKNSWYIFGWSDTVLQYISSAVKGFGGMVDKVRNSKM